LRFIIYRCKKRDNDISVFHKIDAEEVQSYVYPDKRGVHRTATFGDLRERIKDLGALVRFEAIEEDR